jgi:hypothetical protein
MFFKMRSELILVEPYSIHLGDVPIVVIHHHLVDGVKPVVCRSILAHCGS